MDKKIVKLVSKQSEIAKGNSPRPSAEGESFNLELVVCSEHETSQLF